MIKGIDVSSIQGTIDWQAVAATGIEFCIIRCYVGNNGIDSMYATNVAGAKAAGINVMAYNFIFPLPTEHIGDKRDPKTQAQLHFNATNGELAAVDCEWPVQADFGKWGCSSAQINQWMMAYFQEYTRLDNGRKPLIYTYPNWAQTINLDPSFAQYPLWIASYENTPTIPAPFTDWIIWQNTGGTGPNAGHLPSGTPVDTDLAKDLSLWNVAVSEAPAPDPVLPTQEPVAIPIVPAPPPVPVAPSNILVSVWQALSGLFK